MEKYRKILERLEQLGVKVARGLSDEEFTKIEKLYGFIFPRELRDFYSCGLPIGDHFPVWNDFSEENVSIFVSSFPKVGKNNFVKRFIGQIFFLPIQSPVRHRKPSFEIIY